MSPSCRVLVRDSSTGAVKLDIAKLVVDMPSNLTQCIAVKYGLWSWVHKSHGRIMMVVTIE
jgi:hypothetical protein